MLKCYMVFIFLSMVNGNFAYNLVATSNNVEPNLNP